MGRWCPDCFKIQKIAKNKERYEKICENKGKWVGNILPKTIRIETKWKCGKCDKIFPMCYNDVKKGKWCQKCSAIVKKRKRRMDEDDYRNICKEKGEWAEDEIPEDTRIETFWVCWECGNLFPMSYTRIQQGHWCQICAGNAVSTQKDYQDICKNKAKWVGKSLPESTRTRTEWECGKCKKIFLKSLRAVKKGGWCRKCYPRKKKYTKNDYQTVCIDEDGFPKGEWACDELPQNVSFETEWVCWICGTLFWKSYQRVRDGSWCSCQSPFLTIEDYRNVCGEKGEWAEDEVPKNNTTKTWWVCWECGNLFLMPYSSVEQGHWCRICAEVEPKTVKDYENICGSSGKWIGKTLPKNTTILTDWLCLKCNKEFSSLYSLVRQGCWCSTCNKYRTENMCRVYFEKIFEKKFPSKRPSWLLSYTGSRLELDGYCEELGVAFEYQGLQHRVWIPAFSETLEKFDNLLYRDWIKVELCKIFEIKLCIIPDQFGSGNPKKMYEFINSWVAENIKQ